MSGSGWKVLTRISGYYWFSSRFHCWSYTLMTLLMVSVILLIVTLGFSIAASLEPSAHRRNVVTLTLYDNYFTHWEMFIRTGWTDSTSLFSWEVDLFVILMDFTSPFLDVIRMSMSRVPLSSSVPLTYDQNGLKFRVNRHLSSLGSLSSLFLNAFHFCFFFLLLHTFVTLVSSTLRGLNIN